MLWTRAAMAPRLEYAQHRCGGQRYTKRKRARRRLPPETQVMLQHKIDSGARAMGLTLAQATVRKLADYIQLLEKWNRTFNLTAVRDPEQMVARHVLDSLSVVRFLHGRRVLDIGTGAGLPGIPLALACPALQFVLLDSNSKKTRFVTQAIAELGLENASVVQERAEKFSTAEKFDTLISRALGGIADMLTSAAHLAAPAGRFLAMKGVYPEEELAALPAGFKVLAVEALTVPGLDAQRHLVIIAADDTASSAKSLRI